MRILRVRPDPGMPHLRNKTHLVALEAQSRNVALPALQTPRNRLESSIPNTDIAPGAAQCRRVAERHPGRPSPTAFYQVAAAFEIPEMLLGGRLRSGAIPPGNPRQAARNGRFAFHLKPGFRAQLHADEIRRPG